MQSREIETAGLALNYGFSSGIGWFLAIVAIAAIREKIRYSNVPAPFRGLGITFIITGLMAIGFMSFGGMLTGGEDAPQHGSKAQNRTTYHTTSHRKRNRRRPHGSFSNKKIKYMFLAASITGVIAATVIAFLVLTLLLVTLLLFTKQKLSPSGPVTITINGEKEIEVASGVLYYLLLGDKKFSYHLLVVVVELVFNASVMYLRVVEKHCLQRPLILARKELKDWRTFVLPGEGETEHEYYHSRRSFWDKEMGCSGVRNYNVASFIKEFVVEIPEDMNYKAGGYIQIEIPQCEVKFADMDITAHPEEHDTPDKFQAEWDKFNLWPLVMKNHRS